MARPAGLLNGRQERFRFSRAALRRSLNGNLPTRRSIVALAVLAGVLMVSGLAWACTTMAYIQLNPDDGAPGSVTEVTGESFEPGTPIEIRWNSDGGPILGNVRGASYAQEVVIPASARPGVYYIVAVSPGRVARASFEVTDPAVRRSGGVPDDVRMAETRPGTGEPNRGSDAPRQEISEVGGSLPLPDSQPAPEAVSKSAQPGTAARPAAIAPAPQSVSGGTAQASSAASREQREPGSSSAVVPDRRAISADLWSGFGKHRTPVDVDPDGLGRSPLGGGGTPLVAGMILLSAGMVTLAGGVVAALVRRQRLLSEMGGSRAVP